MKENYDQIVRSMNRDRELLLIMERKKVHKFLSRTIEYCTGDYGEDELVEDKEVDDLDILIGQLQAGEKVDYWYLARLADQYDYICWNVDRLARMDAEKKWRKSEAEAEAERKEAVKAEQAEMDLKAGVQAAAESEEREESEQRVEAKEVEEREKRLTLYCKEERDRRVEEERKKIAETVYAGPEEEVNV